METRHSADTSQVSEHILVGVDTSFLKLEDGSSWISYPEL
jgi:hypothetical protein